MLMASSSSSSLLATVFIPFFLFSITTGTAAAQSTGFERGSEKQTQLRFFFQDILSGSSPTAVQIASAPTSSTASTTSPSYAQFGVLTMIDDALTEGEDVDSKLVGRAQGFYAIASKDELALLMTMNLVFTDGDFKGSSISVVGRNPVAESVREMAVVGGSGKFRWAKGYVLARTRRFDQATGDATVQYDVYVIHRGST